ncbi:phage virion morphogenesis protein [Burkholderia gladioli]|uniref:phage virion morphogenesis protein n=1 Tax=Burkholderia gladioli TaxID=28095 RepID=UPI00163E5E31|nr:phage virion morphogenesis protein [Burkholderia gladioli]
MSDELDVLERFAAGLLGALDEAGRRAAARDIGAAMRRGQKSRIAQQRNADDSPYAPRKPRKQHGKALRDKRGRIKRQSMFAALRTDEYMKLESDATGFSIGFASRVSRIARIHQFGERDRVAPHGVEYQYPARQLLGLGAEDRELIRDLLLKHITK